MISSSGHATCSTIKDSGNQNCSSAWGCSSRDWLIDVSGKRQIVVLLRWTGTSTSIPCKPRQFLYASPCSKIEENPKCQCLLLDFDQWFEVAVYCKLVVGSERQELQVGSTPLWLLMIQVQEKSFREQSFELIPASEGKIRTCTMKQFAPILSSKNHCWSMLQVP